MDDLISRQAAINLAKDICVTTEDGGIYRHRCIDPDEIRELPSAQLELKKGKWTPHRLISREYIGTILVNVSYDYWFCDTCGYRVKDGQPMYNFCPNCGAKMSREDSDNG